MEMYPLAVLKARSPKLRCQQGRFPLEAEREKPFGLLLASRTAGNPSTSLDL